MNKTKMILSATGGIALVAVVAMAVLTWMSFSAKTAAREGDDESGTDGLETVMERSRALSAKKPYPCAASVKQIASNRQEVVAWKEAALKLASRGDRPVVPTTPAAFKEFIVSDAKRVAALPSAAGTLVTDDFDFGPFKDYISGGKMPSDSELAALQRKWDDVAVIAETLSSCGITRFVGVGFKTAAAAPEAKENNASRKASRRKRQAQKAAAAAAAEQPAVAGSVAYAYTIAFLAKPAALVKSVNALATSERFMVVEDLGFIRPSDVVAIALGDGDKQEAKGEKEEAKNGIVTDPVLDPPLLVKMTVSVYDFKSLEETKEEKK